MRQSVRTPCAPTLQEIGGLESVTLLTAVVGMFESALFVVRLLATRTFASGFLASTSARVSSAASGCPSPQHRAITAIANPAIEGTKWARVLRYIKPHLRNDHACCGPSINEVKVLCRRLSIRPNRYFPGIVGVNKG